MNLASGGRGDFKNKSFCSGALGVLKDQCHGFIRKLSVFANVCVVEGLSQLTLESYISLLFGVLCAFEASLSLHRSLLLTGMTFGVNANLDLDVLNIFFIFFSWPPLPGEGPDCHVPKEIVGFGPIPARIRGFLISILALSTARCCAACQEPECWKSHWATPWSWNAILDFRPVGA